MGFTAIDVNHIDKSDHKFHYLYKIYQRCNNVCNNSDNSSYLDYGARGIELRFEGYRTMALYILNNLGERPLNHSIDRLDNNGHYEPGNLRWATAAEQANNKRHYKTNSGEWGISFVKRKGTFSVSINGQYKGVRKTLAEAITLRDSQ